MKIRKDYYAVAGVIEALLLVALVAIIISMIQLQYIPQVMEQRESEHMDEVSNQFSRMDALINIQSTKRFDAPLYSIVTLGSRELPYFITARSSGEISIIDDMKLFNITVFWKNQTTNQTEMKIFPLTSIKYEAYNSYFVQQTYTLECGGVFLQQLEGKSVTRVNPWIFVRNESNVTIHFDMPIFIDTPEKNLTSGYGKCFIRTNYSKNDAFSKENISLIRIHTDYINAWNESLSNLLRNNTSITLGSNYVEIRSSIKRINVEINEIYLYVQIGTEWII